MWAYTRGPYNRDGRGGGGLLSGILRYIIKAIGDKFWWTQECDGLKYTRRFNLALKIIAIDPVDTRL